MGACIKDRGVNVKWLLGKEKGYNLMDEMSIIKYIDINKEMYRYINIKINVVGKGKEFFLKEKLISLCIRNNGIRKVLFDNYYINYLG